MSKMTEEEAREILDQKAKEVDRIKKIQSLNELEFTPKEAADGTLTSLGSSQLIQSKLDRREEVRNMAGEIGWKNYDVSYLPSKGMFYNDGMQITIKPATVQEIRHFSTVEDDDLLDVDEKLNFILDKCCRVRNGQMASTYKDLVELDRFALVFAIREITFKEGENKLQMTLNCDQCGNSDNMYVSKETFQLFQLDENIEHLYDSNKRCLVITGEDGEEINLYVPTLGVTQFIKNHIKTKSQTKQYFDKSFLKLAPFLFGNWRVLNEKTYNTANDKTFGWNIDKMSRVILAIDYLQNGVTPEIKHDCSVCGAEVEAPITFQGGIKALFLLSNVFKKQ